MKKFFNFKSNLFLILLLFSATGLLASFVLTVEKIELIKNPEFIPSCNINPLFSCLSVMKTDYAEMFGFPNTIIGLVGYSVMVTVAMFMLFGGSVNRYFMILANLGGLFAFIFSYVLLYISIYIIGAMCPYCLVSCVSATNIFFVLTIYNLKENTFGFSEKINTKMQEYIRKGAYSPIIALWYIFIVFLILIHFPIQSFIA